MDNQVDILRRIHFLPHGLADATRCDREYDKDEFSTFCTQKVTELFHVASNDHESNDLIEKVKSPFRLFN